MHRIRKLPTDDCALCADVGCPAGLCVVCREEADTLAHVLLRCPALWWRRRRLLGDPPDCHGLQDSGVVANLVSGYRALQSLLRIDPAGGRNNNNNIHSQLSDKRRKLSGGKQV